MRFPDHPWNWVTDLAGLFLPRRCSGCDSPLMRREEGICLACKQDLPYTRFHDDAENAVERLFWGRVELEAATALLHFEQGTNVRRILHRLKYKGDSEAGTAIGGLMAQALQGSRRFSTVDAILAVPLHPRKQRLRGYNQSQFIVDGFRKEWPLISAQGSVVRGTSTTTQTRRGRLDRWTNVKEAFELRRPELLVDRHLLLVDDVVTTGATLEGCIRATAGVPGLRISVCTAAFA